MCCVKHKGERKKKRGRPQECICFEFLMTLLLTLLALLHREETAQGCYTMESRIYFNTPFPSLFLVSAPLSLFTVPIPLSHSHRIMPPTHARRRREDASLTLRARSSMRSLFNGCVVPEVAILPWLPLLFSKPCNQCATLCTRMLQGVPP